MISLAIDIVVHYGISGQYVTRVLDRPGDFRELPKVIRTDQGPEFTGKALDQWTNARTRARLVEGRTGRAGRSCPLLRGVGEQPRDGRVRGAPYRFELSRRAVFRVIVNWRVASDRHRPREYYGPARWRVRDGGAFTPSPWQENLPVLMALSGNWNVNFLNLPTPAVLAHDHRLKRFSAYVQQLEMDSNMRPCGPDLSRFM